MRDLLTKVVPLVSLLLIATLVPVQLTAAPERSSKDFQVTQIDYRYYRGGWQGRHFRSYYPYRYGRYNNYYMNRYDNYGYYPYGGYYYSNPYYYSNYYYGYPYYYNSYPYGYYNYPFGGAFLFGW